MLKKSLTALAFLILGLAPALAANVNIPSGPQDPANMGNLINTLIISGNRAYAPQGNSWLTTSIMTGVTTFNAAQAITISGAAGMITPAASVSWLKVQGYINNTTTPTFYMIPLWACPTCN